MVKGKSFIVGIVGSYVSKISASALKGKKVYQSYGLITHVRKRHPECVSYMSKISDIIKNPDYIGINPNEQGISFELVKVYADNVQLGIKLDIRNNYLYVSTIHTVTSSKLKRRINSGRLKKV